MASTQISASDSVSRSAQMVELDQVLRDRLDADLYALYETLAKARILSEDEKFIVNLEHLRLALDWKQKGNAKVKLLKHFVEDHDFIVILRAQNNPKGGRPAEEIRLTLEAAKLFSMLSETSKGHQIRLMFSKVVDIMQDFTHPREPTTSPALVVEDPSAMAKRMDIELQIEKEKTAQTQASLQQAQTSLQLTQWEAMTPIQRQEVVSLRSAQDATSLLQNLNDGHLNAVQSLFLSDYTCNALASGSTRLASTADSGEISSRRFLLPVSDIYRKITGKAGNKRIWQAIGTALASKYRALNKGEDPHKVERFIDGTTREVNAYVLQENPWITEEVENWVRDNAPITRAIAAPVSLPGKGISKYFGKK